MFARRADSTVDVAGLAGCIWLSTRGHTTVHLGGSEVLAADVAVSCVAVATVVRLVMRSTPARLAPILLALFMPGLLLAEARLAVIGFAASALFPVAVLHAVGSRSRWLSGAVLASAAAVFAARLWLRDPFRERYCAPACVTNPYLLQRLPDVVHDSEMLMAIILVTFVANSVRHHQWHRRATADDVAALAIWALATAWAVRLAIHPRPIPDNQVDRLLFVGSMAAVIVAAIAHAIEPIAIGLTRLRIRRFAQSLSQAGDLGAICTRIRLASGDNSVEVELGDRSRPDDNASTSVVRGGRVVATIHHRPAARGRIAAVVSPAVALALETQLVLKQAQAQLEDLERSRAKAVQTADDARRRLERDLHDGAQQRLLVVGMGLAHAAMDRDDEKGARWQAAADTVAEALVELRRIGRGDAAIIAELGLANAVTSLTGTADLPVTVDSIRCESTDHECWPLGVATAAYRLLMGSLLEAHGSGAPELEIELRCMGSGAGRTVTTRHGGRSTSARESDRDRVLAAGGRIITVADATAITFSAWLP